jgi:polysaccharide export outer membrane protein
MKTGERWSCWKSALTGCLLQALLCAPGCLKDRNLDKNLLNGPNFSSRPEEVIESYRVGCPDVIELQVGGRPDCSRHFPVGADGKIDLGEYGRLRVESHTLPEVAHLIADELEASPSTVRVRVVGFRSEYVLLFGEVAGRERSIPYRGQETVVELLQRVGGITVEAAPNDVYVVRPHLGGNQRPEVFHVDLQAIVFRGDNRTNLRILPFDQIYVGETRRAKLEKVLPPWLRRALLALSNNRPNPGDDQARTEPPSLWLAGARPPTEPASSLTGARSPGGR